MVRERLLSVPEAAERLNGTERWVRSLIFTKRIPYHKLGGLVRIAEGDLENFIAKGRQEQSEPSMSA